MAAQTGAKQVERYKRTARARWRAERNREEARRERAWLKAMAAVGDLSSEVEFKLVDVATCSPELLAAIEQGGVLL